MTATASATRAYRQRSILSATPEQLVVMLYDGCGRFLAQGAIALREGEPERAHERLRRAEAIIDHLLLTLDLEAGGELAGQLAELYRFCLRHLNEARLRQDPQPVEEVAALLAEIGTSWSELASR